MSSLFTVIFFVASTPYVMGDISYHPGEEKLIVGIFNEKLLKVNGSLEEDSLKVSHIVMHQKQEFFIAS